MNSTTRAAHHQGEHSDAGTGKRRGPQGLALATMALAAACAMGALERSVAAVTPGIDTPSAASRQSTPGSSSGAARAQSQPSLSASAASAQGPRLTNADERRVAASGALDAQIRTLAGQQAGPFWIAIVQPSARPSMDSCCYSGNSGNWSRGNGAACCGFCALEKDRDGKSSTSTTTTDATPAAPRPIPLEASPDFVMLARVDQQQVERIRFFSPQCALDAGGLRVYTITGVTPAASIAWLESLARNERAEESATTREKRRRDERLSNGAIAAIALHRDPAADAALDRFVAVGRPREQRRDAAFWLASARGQHGFEVVRRLAREEGDQDLRRHAIFCLTVTENPAAVDELLVLAKNGSSAEVRSQALFWVAHAAGKRAVGTLVDAIENDPETQVKEKAVFALSQLPNKEGTPLLIEVAKNNKNREVRKKAMFWLGQSKDPRALEFFESILK